MLTSSVVVGVLSGLARRGDVRRLGQLRFSLWWLFMAAFLVKFFLMVSSARGNPWVLAYGPFVHILVYVALVAALWANVRLPGMNFIQFGILANFAVVLLNGGRMPVSEAALRSIGQLKGIENLRAGLDVTHTFLTSATLAPTLADGIALPAPLSQVVSPGDFLLALGVIWLINRVMCDGGATLTAAPGG